MLLSRNRFLLFWAVLSLVYLGMSGWVKADVPLKRVANTTIQMPAAPPTFGYTWTNAFAGLTFTNPVCIASAPGETNRLFIVEKRGRIVVITNLVAPTRSIFLNITDRVTNTLDTATYEEQGLLALAFHPGYATNGYFYVWYVGNTTTAAGDGAHDILSRFQVSGTNANVGNRNSETYFIAQYDRDNNHNGGDLHFAPDGYLYLSTGDEGGDYGSWGNCQRIDGNFFAAILRIDVDNRPGSLPPNPHPALPSLTNYSIPPDNPYVGATNFNGSPVDPATVRTEFWAVGMRNPWRTAYDPVTGGFYVGGTGQETVEWVSLVNKGSNCGWNYYEGFKQWTNSAQISSAFVWTPPLLQYGHTNGRNCLIGGIVSQGYNLSQLYGAYIYGDYGSGEVFAIRNSGSSVTQSNLLFTDAQSPVIGTFGVDPSNGDILYSAIRGGNNSQIKRIIYNSTTNGAPLPGTLAGTGVFTNLSTLAVAPGVVPYDINASFWSDNAIKSRWFSVPNTNLTIGFDRTQNWAFPTGTVWIKHFELELTNGVVASRRRLETRLLVKNTNGVYGVTYRWGTSTTNATLVSESGLDEVFTIDDGGGILRTQTWHYPSRTECVLCHTPNGGYALGFKTAQVNKDLDYGAGPTNQVSALSLAGYFNASVSNLHLLPAIASVTNEAVSREYRVRSYLAANCSQCHQPGGSGRGSWDARLTVPTSQAGLVNGALYDNLGDSNNAVLKPGSLSNSVMLTRISTPGPLRMPPLASTLLDTNAIQLLSAWITNDLPSWQPFPDSQLAQVSIQKSNNLAQVTFMQLSNRAYEVQSSTNMLNPASWLPFDLPGNEPFFPITNRPWSVTDPDPIVTNKFYRARISAP
jgi:glucose/arabinose dehydrogenase/mono/diheme cytochrome c family protein